MTDKKELSFVLAAYFLLCVLVLWVADFANDLKAERESYQGIINGLEAEIVVLKITSTPTPTPTVTPTPYPTATPFPTQTPTGNISHQEFYNECVARGLVTPAHDYDDRITKERGGYMGESGRETYYNLRMDICVQYMRELGYDEEQYPYWVRDDGAKMLGLYVMCAANWKIRPKGTILQTSLGDAIVVDTGEFVKDYPNGVDLAVDW